MYYRDAFGRKHTTAFNSEAILPFSKNKDLLWLAAEIMQLKISAAHAPGTSLRGPVAFTHFCTIKRPPKSGRFLAASQEQCWT
jgi:hypothetical protein